MHCQKKISKSYFQLFFLNCHKVIPYTVSKVKKAKNVFYVCFI
jgi:hypothetical protein